MMKSAHNIKKIHVSMTKQNQKTIKVDYFDYAYQRDRTIQLCSQRQPVEQAEKWANELYDESADIFFIYGIGVGYHIKALQQRMHTGQKIIVIETQYALYECLEEEGILETLMSCKNISIKMIDSIDQCRQIMTRDLCGNVVIGIYTPCLELIPEALQDLRILLKNHQLRKWNVQSQQEMIICNINNHKDKNYVNVESLYGTVKDKPIVIVAAGPSLKESLDSLKKYQQDVFIIAVGRVVKLLIQNGIRVDLFCLLDGQQLVYKHIEGIEESGIPLVFMNTVAENIVNKYKGPKYIAYSVDSPREQKGRIETGGSVVTLCIAVATQLGSKKIILTGQDLAYTDGRTHIGADDLKPSSAFMKKSQGIDGIYYPTNDELLSFKWWIERKVRERKDLLFINSTAKGLLIQGCIHQELDQAILENKKEKL